MNERFDRWVQAVTVATLVTLAAVLVTVGFQLYAPTAQTGAATTRMLRR